MRIPVQNRPVAAWTFWLIGSVVLVGAGFGSAYLPRLRSRQYARQAAWSAAQAAIESASVSRDAAPGPLVEAEQLLARAESIAATRGGTAAARTAAGYAEQADRLWRAATGG
ncbi:MAG: hypothetical protein J2P15_23460 [Micromonosporaceae bacterium]|nr:hypothetical protein [Micromonosporaceae bacterium]